ncbi:hypothetical protein L596_017569 [Steinernema carpocapsae]|uniref:G-protein coupled receptors family 1 profile domain-containing protein n=1 Tax=Steinernema carpocapsae TaxID=34508 RepID=A0A4U5N2A9_STECR|nr:hypothetical protein L596_017569 [Steinernema carpocapsae]
MSPYVFYTNHLLSLFCSILTVVLSTIVLYRHVTLKTPTRQYTMIFIVVRFQILYALNTAVYCIYCIVMQQVRIPNLELTFWHGTVTFALNVATRTIEIFPAVDRIIAVSYPFAYKKTVKYNVCCCLAFSAFVFLALILCFVAYRLPQGVTAIAFNGYADEHAFYVIATTGLVFCCSHISLTIVVILKVRQFKKKMSASTSGGTAHTRKANSIVLYQMVLAVVFEVVPVFMSLFIGIVWNVQATHTVGPIETTLLAVYVFTCSILHWKKQRKTSDSS